MDLSKDRYFKILASAVAACVLLLMLFLIFVAGLTLHSLASFCVLLVVMLIGAAEVVSIYHVFMSKRSSSVLLPHKLALFTATQLFAVVELVLIGIYMRSAPAAGQAEIGASYILQTLLGVVLYIVVYASILFWGNLGKKDADSQAEQKAGTRNVAAALSGIIVSYNQLAGQYQSLDFSKTKILFDKLAVKSRALGVLGRSGQADAEWDLVYSCEELKGQLDQYRNQENIQQEHVNEIHRKTSQILQAIQALDRAGIQ